MIEACLFDSDGTFTALIDRCLGYAKDRPAGAGPV
jgi:hypothetical protein